MKKIRTVDKEIQKLMGLESQFLDRLRLTIAKEANLWKDIDQLHTLKDQIQGIKDVEQLEKFLTDNAVVRNLRSSTNLYSDRNKGSPKAYKQKQPKQVFRKKIFQEAEEEFDEATKLKMIKPFQILTPRTQISKHTDLLAAFQQRMKA